MLLRKLAEVGFVVVLLVAVPALSYRTSKTPEVFALPRLKLYLSAVLSQWLLAALGMLVFLVTSMDFATVGFRLVSAPVLLFWTGTLTGVSLGALGLVVWLERKRWWPPEPQLVYALIPQTRLEKLWAVLIVAPTAALCEEFLYRGLLLAELTHRFHSVAWGCLLSSVAFGMAHFYQGFNGIARAALLGVLLALPVIRVGTVLPSMASHFLIDIVALLWIGPKMYGSPRTHEL